MSWVTITDFPNYEVSDAGEVRNSKTGKLKKSCLTNKGYYRIELRNDTTCKHYSVHRLVAQHFIENPENKPQVDHIDRNRTNNHVSNLRWATASENLYNKSFFARKHDGTHHITTIHDTLFRVEFRGYISKNFKTLEDAVAFRDQWMADHPR